MKNNCRSAALSTTAPDVDTRNWTALLRVSSDYNLRMVRKFCNQLAHECQVFTVVVICIEESRASYNRDCRGNALVYDSSNLQSFSEVGSLTLAFGARTLLTDRYTKVLVHHRNHKVLCGFLESTELVLGDL